MFIDVLPFDGLTVLVTGVIPSMSRTGAQNAIADLGGKAASSVTGKVDLIVLGDGAGLSKTQKARDLGLLVLPGETFAAYAADPTTWDGERPGLTFEAYDLLDPEQDDDPADHGPMIPLAERHLLTKIVVYPLQPDANGRMRPTRQICMSCQCGHRWLGTTLQEWECPVEAGRAALQVLPPWRNEPTPTDRPGGPAVDSSGDPAATLQAVA